MNKENSLTTVETFISPWDAHIAKGRLEAEGIPVFIVHEHHIWANWIYSQALGGVKLQVPTNYAEEALKVIRSHIKGEYESSLPDELAEHNGNMCSKCGSTDFKSKYPIALVVLVILTLGLFAIIFPLRKDRHSCRNCGNEWAY